MRPSAPRPAIREPRKRDDAHRTSDSSSPCHKYGSGGESLASRAKSLDRPERDKAKSEAGPAEACDGPSRPTTVFSGSMKVRATMHSCDRRRGFLETFCAAASCHAACRGMGGLRDRTITPCALWRCAYCQALRRVDSAPSRRVRSSSKMGLCASGRGSSVSSRRAQPPARAPPCSDEAPDADGEPNRNSAGECAARHSCVPRRPA